MSHIDFVIWKAIVLCVLAFFYGAWREYVNGKPNKRERRDKE